MRISLAICNPGALALEVEAFARIADPAKGLHELDCLQRATAASLHQLLLDRKPAVLYVVARCKERAAAGYAVVTLCSSKGEARDVSARSFAQALGQHRCLRLVILQPCDGTSASFTLIAKELVNEGMAVITTPVMPLSLQGRIMSRLIQQTVLGVSAVDLASAFRAVASSEGLSGFLLFSPAEQCAVDVAGQHPRTPAASPWPEPAHEASGAAEALTARARAELEQKRERGEFDVFLCHNSADKDAVQALASQLRELGILPWLDIWELPPGRPWQPLLEEQIGRIRSAAVLVGRAGIGPWQEQEMYGFLRVFVERQAPVIPVVLADAPDAPNLPVFLRAMTWVDFRAPESRPLERLVWGVTGKRPWE